MAEEVEIEEQRPQTKPLLERLTLEHLMMVLSLRPSGQLQTPGDQVKRTGQRRVFWTAHVVKRPHHSRPIGQEKKVVLVLLPDVLAQQALAGRVDITFLARRRCVSQSV